MAFLSVNQGTGYYPRNTRPPLKHGPNPERKVLSLGTQGEPASDRFRDIRNKHLDVDGGCAVAEMGLREIPRMLTWPGSTKT